MLGQDNKARESQRTSLVPILIGVLAVAATGGTILYLQSTGNDTAEAVLTDAARAYLSNLDLSDVNMEANEDALGLTLLEITGDIANLGDSTVTLVEANCVFRDVNGLEIERQRSAFVNRRSGPLAPGERRSFRMAFDSVPEGWNQIRPDLYIAQIQFDE